MQCELVNSNRLLSFLRIQHHSIVQTPHIIINYTLLNYLSLSYFECCLLFVQVQQTLCCSLLQVDKHHQGFWWCLINPDGVSDNNLSGVNESTLRVLRYDIKNSIYHVLGHNEHCSKDFAKEATIRKQVQVLYWMESCLKSRKPVWHPDRKVLYMAHCNPPLEKLVMDNLSSIEVQITYFQPLTLISATNMY